MTSVLSSTFLDGDTNCPLSVESNNAVVHRNPFIEFPAL